MPNEQLDLIKKRFDFAAWRGINQLDRELSAREIKLPKGLIAGIDPKRIRVIDPGDGSRLLRMSWSDPEQEAALFVMDIHECKSREAAHEALLELLANMQAPDIKRLEQNAPGDIAFAQDASKAIVFARGNITFSIRNGGEQILPIDELAKTVDQWVMEYKD